MAKPKAVGTLEELVNSALATALENVNEFRLVKSGQTPGLFPSSTGSGKLAIDSSMAATEPLFEEVRRAGKTVFVRPTTQGMTRALSTLPTAQAGEVLLRLIDQLPPERLIAVARKWIGSIPVAERATYLAEITSRAGPHGVELQGVVREDEEQAKRAERESYRVKYEVARNDHTERRLRAEEDARWHAAAERQFEDLLRNLAAPSEPPSPPLPPAPPLPLPTGAERDFRKAVVEEMVETWSVALQRKNAEAVTLLECMLRNIPSVERIGEKGQPATFNPGLHDSEDYCDTGTSVVVRSPGWLLRGEKAPYVIRKATVGPA